MIINQYRKDSITNSNPITAKIQSSQLEREDSIFSSQHAIYCVSLTTNSQTWTIRKRYSDFLKLDNDLREMSIGPLPDFPPKRFNSISQNTINERMNILEIYLNSLFYHYNIEIIDPIIDFIRFSKEVFELYLKCNNLNSNQHQLANNLLTHTASQTSNEIMSKLNNLDLNQNYYNSFYQFKLYDDDNEIDDDQSATMCVCEEFLRNLNTNPENRINIINEFEAYLREGRRIIEATEQEINVLFFGFNFNNVLFKGLVSNCGNINENKLGAQRCLKFVYSLINCEMNPNVEKFVSIFQKARNEDIASMALSQHLTSNSSNVNNIASEIIFIISNYQLEIDDSVKNIINDKRAEQKYSAWLIKFK